ncbi:dipeptidase [Roseomonas sp. NAR14]|uniref:Dipeptidase n=1 Tax=Roseomonas acroporae TaxID=2937791 RepID=A0A9X1YGH3_9PROT|nr:dipeptidase [Roseomonas acroporae]MCK8785836.1 dipeptidase [Roseomonas acroporae]
MTDAETLHDRLLTLDSHVDIPWPEAPDPFGDTTCRVDLPKMRRGHLVAACLAAYVPQGPLTDEGHRIAAGRAEAMLARIAGMGGARNGIEARVVDTVDAVEQAHRDGAIALIPAVENGYAIGEDLSLLARFRAVGARYVTLCHNGHNLITDSANPRADLGDGEARHGGLSEFGRAAIAEMNRLGMLVDVSHVSRAGMLQAAGCSATPVVATHSCVRALCDHPRNLDDAQLDVLRETGGLVQITAVPGFLRRRAGFDQVGVADYCDHLDHVARRCGPAHVGISSDFDGGGGFRGWGDASESGNLTAELLRRGWGEAEIAGFWGGNFLRLLRHAEALAAG